MHLFILERAFAHSGSSAKVFLKYDSGKFACLPACIFNYNFREDWLIINKV